MDLSTQYHHYQQQTHDPSSQFQSYDQSTEAYYTFHQYNQYIQQQQQYPYHTQDYTFSYQQQEPTSVYPPGVPIEHELGQTHLQNPFYNPHGVSDPPIGQIPYGDGGRRGDRPFRGGGPGRFGSPFRGRGRGRGRGGPSLAPANNPATFVQGESSQGTPAWPPPRMAWCELCRVDCNTHEILEQHKNGKRHKKNLQVHEDLQKLNNRLLVEVQNEQIPVAEVKQDIPTQPEKAMGSEHKQSPQENVASQAVTEKNKVESGQQKVSEEAEYTEEPARKPEKDHFEGRGRGLKRKMRGRRGSKRMRTHEGSRRPIEPPKPKQVVTLVCDLCNVKCDSQVVFDSHLTGKKHLLNLKRYQGHQTMLGQAALQALYPALQALYPALQALNPPNPNVSVSFGPQFHHEGNHGSQDLFPHLASLLFSQGQASAPEPGTSSALAQPSVLENPNHQYPNSQHPQIASEPLIPGAAIVEAKNQQQPLSENPEAESAASAGTKSDKVVLFETDNNIGEPQPNSL